ncbi:MAG: outer membrane beta-barrel protein [Calditrichia bacterium]
MKNRVFNVITVTLMSIILAGALFAEDWPRTGIGMRFSHWNVKDNVQMVRVYTDLHSTEVDAGGYGGTLFFFSRLTPQLFIEFSVGVIGTVEQRTKYRDYDEVKTNAVAPLLFGVRYNVLPREVQSVLQPYGEAGFGTYWISDIYVENDRFYDSHDNVTIHSEVRPGGYVGAGLNFMLSRKFAINYDMRYHMVDFSSSEYQNGIEFGLGCSFMWGK